MDSRVEIEIVGHHVNKHIKHHAYNVVINVKKIFSSIVRQRVHSWWKSLFMIPLFSSLVFPLSGAVRRTQDQYKSIPDV